MAIELNKNRIAQCNVGNNLDVIASLDPKGYGVYKILYDLATAKAGGSYSMAAAKKINDILSKGEKVFFITGFVLTPFLKAETDGIAGTVMLARVLKKAYGIVPIYFCPKDAERGLKALTDKFEAAGQIIVFEKDVNLANSQAEDIIQGEFFNKHLEGKLPKACISIEAPGANVAGVYHNAAGLDVTCHEGKMDILFKKLQEMGVTTFAIGDLGNEIGMGALGEGICRYIPRTAKGECNCGCGGGILAATCADYLVTGTTSDWAAYALANAVAFISDKMELSPDRETVKLLLESEGQYGLIDMLGEPIAAVDGYDLEINLMVVSLMNKLVKDFKEQSKPYIKWYEEVALKGYFEEKV